jgi:hypothetical protein
MKRLKIFGLAIFAVFALSACAAAAASAEELQFLPEGTAANPVFFTAKSGAGTLQNAALEIKCLTDKGTGEVTSKRLGNFEVTFEDCTTISGTTKCASLDHADSTGLITVMGEFHMRRGLSGQPLVLIAFLILHVHILCGVSLILVLGCAAGEITKAKELTAKLEVLLKAPAITTIDTDAETGMENCKLTVEQGTVTTEGTEVTHEEVENFEQPKGTSVKALIMD